MSTTPPAQFFVSYSHLDRAWREQLFDGPISTPLGDCPLWTDACIQPGDDWRAVIEQQLAQCSVAVLLVSPHFLQSAFITGTEFPRFLARAEAHQVRIVWIPIAVTPQMLGERHPLASVQGILSFDDALPARPEDLPPWQRDARRTQVHQQLAAALDLLGAELARLVDHRYRLRRRLGEGNLAAIYAADDEVLGRRVVIKALKDASQRQAFIDDVRDAIPTSEEPNFLNIYHVGTDRPPVHCVMQHVDGSSLAGRLRAQPQGLPLLTVRKLLLRVATAVARAHALGIAHGNLKPSNILLDGHDEPFILPIGRRPDAAREAARLDALLRRRAGGVANDDDAEDLAYLVPEAFGGIGTPDARLADQYMLGLLAWHMATGELPPTQVADAAMATDGMLDLAELPALSLVRPLFPQSISGLVARMTAVQPAERLLGREQQSSLQPLLDEPDLHADWNLVMARDSYRRCEDAGALTPAFFEGFYAAFEHRCEDAAAPIARLRSANWQRQLELLKQAVVLLLAFFPLGESPAEPHVLSRIAASHRGIPARMYAHFAETLIGCLCGDAKCGLQPADPVLRSGATPALRGTLVSAWRCALAPGLKYLTERAGY